MLNFYKKPPTEECSDSIPKREYVFSLLLWPRSLLVLRHSAYTSYLHEIEELTCDIVSRGLAPTALDAGDDDDLSQKSKKHYANLDTIPEEELTKFQRDEDSNSWTIPRETRYSFTIRYVPKVLKSVSIQKLLGKS